MQPTLKVIIMLKEEPLRCLALRAKGYTLYMYNHVYTSLQVNQMVYTDFDSADNEVGGVERDEDDH